MMLSIILSLIIVYLFYVFALKSGNHWKQRNVAHIKPLPIFGNTTSLFLQNISFARWMDNLYSKFPNERFFGIFQFSQPQLVLRDPNLIKQITIKDFDNFINRSATFSDIDPIFSRNLPFLRDQQWRDARAALSPSFTSNKMKFLYQLVYECAEKFTKYFEDNPLDAESIEMKDYFSRFANDVIATSAFGIHTDSINNKNNEFFLNGKTLTDFSRLKMFMFLLYSGFPSLKKIIKVQVLPLNETKFFQEVINETLKLRRKNNIVRPDMIHLLLQSQSKSDSKKTIDQKNIFTDFDIAAQAIVFFLAGFDTVSTALSFVSYELALNEDIQKKLQIEIDDVMKTAEGQVPYDVLMNLKYLDMVVSESLRKWPPAIVIERMCSKDYKIQRKSKEHQPLIIRKDDLVIIPIRAIHHDPKIFPNPETLDPERFSDENKHKIISGSYMPFGIGPRNCIASRFAQMEVKTILFNLLYKFDIVKINKTEIPLILGYRKAVPYVDKGIWLSFKKRKIDTVI